jgi:ABC-type amino acid transport substrate-binding protein
MSRIPLSLNLSLISCLALCITVTSLFAQDLADVRKEGVLRHLAIPYANFYTGRGDGLDVELIRGFAREIGVRYELVETSWQHVFGDLTGQNACRDGDKARFLDTVPIRGDIIANGMTILPWRKEIVRFSTPAFPSGVWLVARADSNLTPIRPSGNLAEDIARVKAQLAGHSVMVLPSTCLDPGLYGMQKTGAIIKVQPPERKLNELVPAILNNDAEATLLDVPDALIALARWPGRVKVIGPISKKQEMAAAFRKDSPELLAAFNRYFKKISANGTYQRMVKKYYPTVFRYSADFFAPAGAGQ